MAKNGPLLPQVQVLGPHGIPAFLHLFENYPDCTATADYTVRAMQHLWISVVKTRDKNWPQRTPVHTHNTRRYTLRSLAEDGSHCYLASRYVLGRCRTTINISTTSTSHRRSLGQ
jgi:hypothetical protein